MRREVVERKLDALSEYLDELRALRPPDFQQYRADLGRRRAIERVLQLIIETATDINTHVAVESGHIPDDYFESFWSAARVGAISEELARVLAPSAGLRNRLVHEYDSLDDAQVFASIDMALELFPEYLRQIVTFLNER